MYLIQSSKILVDIGHLILIKKTLAFQWVEHGPQRRDVIDVRKLE